MPAAKPPISLDDAQLPSDRPFTLAEARRHGVSSADLGKLIRSGGLHRLFRGVFAAQPIGSTIDRARALALAVGDSAVVTGRTAAWLYGVDLDQQTAGYSIGRRLCWNRSLHRYAPDDLRIIDGCCVTTPLRTACDLGRTESEYVALGALDALLRLGDFCHDQLRDQVPRFRGRSGVAQLRELVPLADARSDSLGASALRMHWIRAGLPDPELRLPILAEGGRRIEFDLADPAVRYAAVLEPDDDRPDGNRLGDDRLDHWTDRTEDGRIEDGRTEDGRTVGRWIPALQQGWFVDILGPREVASWGSARHRVAEGHRRASDRRRSKPDERVGWDEKPGWPVEPGWPDEPGSRDEPDWRVASGWYDRSRWSGAVRWSDADRDGSGAVGRGWCRDCGRRIEPREADREWASNHWL
ncbi:type IV toxin-antitoxin system AbiEi family antitoxin domain-containing protein [Microlunatus soli]|uniref:Transcriptional regulator, AbiEi antitoxin, Type IV TA system n=1 Tax=Microlunatus soli TaxID=630515 RepID=A0A1H1XXR7_9ACTN|nr:type IV toxin-antitoxin system AbiEi family antitoxin domain-containing protein [Microlunatus soli]SDT13821.1 hypothetical protein SAMN04489812_4286 [Microlunatus soli]